MKIPFRQKPNAHRDELLAGFADQELKRAQAREVEERLCRDARAADLLAEQRWVTHLWREDTVPVPDEATWARVLAGIESGLEPAPTHQRVVALPENGNALGVRVHAGTKTLFRPRDWARSATRWASAAAALWLLMAIQPLPSYHPPVAQEIAPLPVMASEDVDMVTIHGADFDRLVVGTPMLPGSLDIAGPGDINIDSVQRDTDGMLPVVHRQSDSAGPMVVAPLGEGPWK